MMNISFLCSMGDQVGTGCATPHNIVGKEINIPAESKKAHWGNGRVVIEVPGDQILLVNTCLGYDHLKTISPDYSFFRPVNDDQLNDVKPYLNELIKRKIIVLTEVKRPDIQDIKEDCRKSFYTPEGELFNKKFNQRNLSPLRMGEAGLKFVGDKSHDWTQCCVNPNHILHLWEESDDPVAEHLRHCQRSCIDDMKYKIPVLSAIAGEEIKEKAYHVLMADGPEERSGGFCNSATVLSHPGAPLKIIASRDVFSVIDHAKLDKMKAFLEKKTEFS
ncbi:baculoviral IAP repeat-containing protein [Endozoicomonas sp. ONNA2]|uniref:baculoviral IAP repeat-containing protein n=1 Tax=Endozoicomonas sp. ONNA2 TaxID=2828741 RepID=UPI00214743B3|nr:baculoviral IAP repeat-containing protein [Endozoicomonas sp. ONNA2]